MMGGGGEYLQLLVVGLGPAGCFNKHNGPSDQAMDHSAMDK